jgi:hypothetical protein
VHSLVIEFFRGDVEGFAGGLLSIAIHQLMLIIVAVVLFFYLKQPPAKTARATAR